MINFSIVSAWHITDAYNVLGLKKIEGLIKLFQAMIS